MSPRARPSITPRRSSGRRNKEKGSIAISMRLYSDQQLGVRRRAEKLQPAGIDGVGRKELGKPPYHAEVVPALELQHQPRPRKTAENSRPDFDRSGTDLGRIVEAAKRHMPAVKCRQAGHRGRIGGRVVTDIAIGHAQDLSLDSCPSAALGNLRGDRPANSPWPSALSCRHNRPR